MTDQISIFLEHLGTKHRKEQSVCGWRGGEEVDGGTTDMRDKLGFICRTSDSNIFA